MIWFIKTNCLIIKLAFDSRKWVWCKNWHVSEKSFQTGVLRLFSEAVAVGPVTCCLIGRLTWAQRGTTDCYVSSVGYEQLVWSSMLLTDKIAHTWACHPGPCFNIWWYVLLLDLAKSRRIVRWLWNLTDTSVALLLMCLSNFKVML